MSATKAKCSRRCRIWAASRSAPIRPPFTAIANTIPAGTRSLDLKHLLTCAEAITRSALDRKESRGGHFREDFPEKSAEAAKVNTVVWKAADGSMQLRREPIPPMPEELKQVVEEMK